ncbi:hypothetical protein P170DRAFT_209032 [Aspergillus steynii IBT 23096]|uniref:Secreted protein n=1 Tax=Aspergillus steynii IBT 23096 TaxID=1392250 RepID=A0A2I2G5U5_9EURO|nr:uncharacterized protein P170DRAFT_209032 [Aspergillus steynii IBT 23096]PLB48251.1 hypothetical protein P170DRAFT_209032 [Aspergillus steynii IBT 23096]
MLSGSLFFFLIFFLFSFLGAANCGFCGEKAERIRVHPSFLNPECREGAIVANRLTRRIFISKLFFFFFFFSFLCRPGKYILARRPLEGARRFPAMFFCWLGHFIPSSLVCGGIFEFSVRL